MPSVAAIGYGPLLHSQAWTGVHGRSGFSTAAGPSAGSCFSRLCVMSLVPQPLDLLAPTSTLRSSVQVEITCSEHKSLFWQLFFFFLFLSTRDQHFMVKLRFSEAGGRLIWPAECLDILPVNHRNWTTAGSSRDGRQYSDYAEIMKKNLPT